jgi:hypothetical protein
MAKSVAQEKWVRGAWRGENAHPHAGDVTITHADGTVETRPPLPPGPLERVHSVRGDTEAGAILSELSEAYFTPHPE